MIKVVVSGGWDPLHDYHLDHIQEAKRLGDWLIVIANTDEFLIRKKGFFYLPLLTRLRLLEEYPFVDQVVVCIDRDQTVAETLRLIRPNIFAKGGDRESSSSMPQQEVDACKDIGCKIVYGVDRGERASSSSYLLEGARITDKPWGYEKELFRTPLYCLKLMHLNKGESLSLQDHSGREETWRVVEGFPLVEANGTKKSYNPSDIISIPVNSVHRMSAPQGDVTVMEMSIAHLDMGEIRRLDDKYGRKDEN